MAPSQAAIARPSGLASQSRSPTMSTGTSSNAPSVKAPAMTRSMAAPVSSRRLLASVKTAYEAPAPSASTTPGTDTSAAEPLSAISATPTAASAVATAHALPGLGAVDEPAAESGERRRGAERCDRAHRDSGGVDGGEEAELVARHAEAAHGERPAREAERRAAGGEPH